MTRHAFFLACTAAFAGWGACLPALGAEPSLYALHVRWIDEFDRPLDLSALRDRPVVVAMEYSDCKFVCSSQWLKLQELQRWADGHRQDLQFVILSLDPPRDSPEAWRDYRKVRKLDRSNWHFLTADAAARDAASRVIGERWWFDEDHLMHDFRVVRLAADGRVAAVMTSFDQTPESFLGPP
jgi:protein SCO1/2